MIPASNSLRLAQASDLEDIVRLVNSAYRGDSARAGWTHEADLLDGTRISISQLEEVLEDPDQSILILPSEDRLIACVLLKREPQDVFYFGMLTVQPGLQAKGTGKKILGEIEERAKVSGGKQMRLSVINHRSELIAYYERRGYLLTGNSEAFPEHNVAFGLLKQSDVRMLEMLKELT